MEAEKGLTYVSSADHQSQIESGFRKIPAYKIPARVGDFATTADEAGADKHINVKYRGFDDKGFALLKSFNEAAQEGKAITLAAQPKNQHKSAAPGASLDFGPKH